MASEWQRMHLGDAIELKRGYDLPSRDRREGPFPIVSSAGISGRHASAKAKAPGVVIGRYGTLGEVHYITEDYWPLNTALYVRDFKGNDPKFVSYFLRSVNVAAYSDKAAVPGLNRNDLHTARVSIPPATEQRAIAHILGTLDDKIELNRRRNQTLEAMARALFKDWFIDFDPVRAKIENREPYLPADLWQLFPDRLDHEGKPEGWANRPVGDFAELKGGKQLEKEKIVSAGPVPVFGGAGVMGYTDNHNADGFVITVGRVGAYCGQFFCHRGKAWINNNASLIRQTDDELAEWLFLALNHADIDVIKKGAAQPFVSNGDIAKLPLMWPSGGLLRAFTAIVTPVQKKKDRHDAETRTIAQLRDTLLPKLISGELRIADAEKLLEYGQP